MVVDLAYGDSGKGTIVDFLTRQCGAHTIVRFNGGPQAGHNVVTSDGRHHTFSQIGSGAFVPGVRTLLSRFMLIEPYAMLNEAAHLQQIGVRNPLESVMIDRRCPVITPPQQATNRLREIARGQAAHGTCGQGIGETMQDSIENPDLILRAAELGDRATVRKKLQTIRDLKSSQLREIITTANKHPQARQAIETLLDDSWIEAAIDNYAEVNQRTSIIDDSAAKAIVHENGTLIFEGAQGVLLDENFGFHPHTTWSTTTFANAQTVLDEAVYQGQRTRIGVLRAYITRHGQGPLVTQQDDLCQHLNEPHNTDQSWPGRFRVGPFDAVAARYALAAAGGADALAITHLDRLPFLPNHFCNAYNSNTELNEEPFEREDNRITNIKVHRPPSLAHQEKLTNALRHCHPIVTPIEHFDSTSFIAMVERELRTPVAITSTGRLHHDKSIRDFAGRLAPLRA